jgi:hypothetical protein
LLRDGTFYQDLGASHFHRSSPEDQAKRLARKIASLGFNCILTPAANGAVSVLGAIWRDAGRARSRLSAALPHYCNVQTCKANQLHS